MSKEEGKVSTGLSLNELRDLSANLTKVEQIHGIPFVRVPEGQVIKLREDLMPAPATVRSKIKVHDVNSLVEYIKRFGGSDGRKVVVFYGVKECKMRVYLDYHSSVESSGEIHASWCNHLADFELEPTVEWAAWMSNSHSWMPQDRFAEFLEDRQDEIVKDHVQPLLDVAEKLHVSRDVKIASGKRLSDGNIQFIYEEDTKATSSKGGGNMTVPSVFSINLVPYTGLDGVKLNVRFKYRIGKDGCQMRYELVAAHKVKELRMTDVVASMQQDLAGLPAIQYINGWLEKLPEPRT